MTAATVAIGDPHPGGLVVDAEDAAKKRLITPATIAPQDRPTLVEARSDYHVARDHRMQAERGYDKAKLDSDSNDFGKRAAQAYLDGKDAGAASAHVDRAAGARAALPSLRERLKSAISAEEFARAAFRRAIIDIVRERFAKERDEYVANARAMQAAYVRMYATHRMLSSFIPSTEPLHAALSQPIFAACPSGVKSPNPYLQHALIATDAVELDNAAQPRVFEIERDLRAIAGDVWPFGSDPVPNYRLTEK